MTDAELIAAYRTGDEKAFGVLVNRHTPNLRSFLMHSQLQEIEPPERYEVVSDILQEVWLRIFHNVAQFDPEKKFTNWLFTMATNLARNEYRDRKRRASRMPHAQLAGGAAEFEFCASEALQPDFLCEQRDTLEHLSKYLSKNASRENVVVLELREVQGYTYSEIAQWLNIPVGTVKSRLSRVRAVAKRFAKEYA